MVVSSVGKNKTYYKPLPVLKIAKSEFFTELV
jgi:hypothetical protein